MDNSAHSLCGLAAAKKGEEKSLNEREEGVMNQEQVNYHGFVITAMAAYDGGLYAAMTIIGDGDGLQRASGVLGHFASPDEALRFALLAGKDDVDRRAWPATRTPAAA